MKSSSRSRTYTYIRIYTHSHKHRRHVWTLDTERRHSCTYMHTYAQFLFGPFSNRALLIHTLTHTYIHTHTYSSCLGSSAIAHPGIQVQTTAHKSAHKLIKQIFYHISVLNNILLSNPNPTIIPLLRCELVSGWAQPNVRHMKMGLSWKREFDFFYLTTWAHLLSKKMGLQPMADQASGFRGLILHTCEREGPGHWQ